LSLPDDEQWRADFLGAFFELAKIENWEQFETLTPQEMADEWVDVFGTFAELEECLVPPGFIGDYAGGGVPDGWLFCNGDEVSRITYADLFAAIGTIYGAGDGSTTFGLPNAVGRVSVCVNIEDIAFNALGETGGSPDVALDVSQLPTHTHLQNAHNHTQNTHTHLQDTHNHTQNTHNHSVPGTVVAVAGGAGSVTALHATTPAVTSGSTVATNITVIATNQTTVATNQTTVATNQTAGDGEAHNNLQPYIVFNRIIKF